MLALIKKNVILSIVIGAAIIGFGAYFVWSQNATPDYVTVAATRGTIKQQVSVTGRVSSAETAELAFERTGKVARIERSVGDPVATGQTIIALENAELIAELNQAIANVKSNEAKLDELKKGIRIEERNLLESKVINAERTLTDAELAFENVKAKTDLDLTNLYGEVRNTVSDAYIKADDAVNKLTDDLFSDDTSSNPQLVFITGSGQTKSDAQLWRFKAGREIANFQIELNALTESRSDLDAQLQKTEQHLLIVKTFLDMLTTAVNDAVGVSPTTIATYKANINTGRANVNTALTNVTTKKQLISAQYAANKSAVDAAQANINVAKSALDAARLELSLKLAGASNEQIEVQKALVEQAEASLAAVRAQLAKSVLSAPFNGIITAIIPKVGEIVAPNTPVVSLISESEFQIEANLAEADLAKIQIGNSAEVTLDAYGSEVVFDAIVSLINPAETIIDGVATYKITLVFVTHDSRIRSGMTANVDIITAEKNDVLIVPQRAIISSNGNRKVQILENGGAVSEKEVVIGIRDINGMTEILSGIHEGDQVIVP